MPFLNSMKCLLLSSALAIGPLGHHKRISKMHISLWTPPPWQITMEEGGYTRDQSQCRKGAGTNREIWIFLLSLGNILTNFYRGYKHCDTLMDWQTVSFIYYISLSSFHLKDNWLNIYDEATISNYLVSEWIQNIVPLGPKT